MTWANQATITMRTRASDRSLIDDFNVPARTVKVPSAGYADDATADDHDFIAQPNLSWRCKRIVRNHFEVDRCRQKTGHHGP